MPGFRFSELTRITKKEVTTFTISTKALKIYKTVGFLLCSKVVNNIK